MSKPITAARHAVKALLEIELGEPFADAAASATAAIDETRAAAEAKLFPDRLDFSPSAYAALARFEARFQRLSYTDQLAGLHRRALAASFDELSALLRARSTLDDVGAVAATTSVVRATPEAELHEHHVRRYKELIAKQLVNHEGELGEAAKAAVAAADLENEVSADVERRQRHNQSQIEAEQKRQRDLKIARDREALRRDQEQIREAAELERKAKEMRREAKLARAQSLIERLQRSGERRIRDGAGRLFDVDQICSTLRQCRPETLTSWEHRLDELGLR